MNTELDDDKPDYDDGYDDGYEAGYRADWRPMISDWVWRGILILAIPVAAWMFAVALKEFSVTLQTLAARESVHSPGVEVHHINVTSTAEEPALVVSAIPERFPGTATPEWAKLKQAIYRPGMDFAR